MAEVIVYYPDRYGESDPAMIEGLTVGKLVRCKDCWRKGNPFECRLASDVQEHGGSITEEYDDWFCADGERREQNG